jgi:hypothetical protein
MEIHHTAHLSQGRHIGGHLYEGPIRIEKSVGSGLKLNDTSDEVRLLE